MATFGSGVALNGMVWQYGMGIVLPLVAIAYVTLLGLAFNKAFGELSGSN